MSTQFSERIARCRTAQKAWSELPLRQRLGFIRPLRHAFAAHADRLCLATTHDVGRPAEEVLGTDVLPVADALRYLEHHATRMLRAKRVSGLLRPWWLVGERETVHRRARGLIGIIGTWNYPILLNAVTIAQALVAGNGVVWKPSEQAPSTAEYLHGLFLAAGVPEDLFLCLPASREGGSQLIEEDIDHVVFTGSADVGRRVAARLGERLISSTLELSGCDALLALEDADISLAARAAWFGATLNAGQTCLGVRRAFVHRKRYDAFVNALRPLAANSRPEPLVMLSQAQQAERLVKDALATGAGLLTGDAPTAAVDPPRFRPTVLVNATVDMAICQDASFAPLLSVIPFDDEAKLAELTERCGYGLGASIFSSDIRRAKQLASRLRVGSVSINDAIVATAHPATGFGGVRNSGWGVTRGEEGLLALTVPQVASTRLGKFRPHFQTSSPALAEMLRGLLAWYHSASGRERRAGFWRTVRGFLKYGKS